MLTGFVFSFQLRHIPTSGSSFPIFSYLEGLRWLTDGAKMIQEGYDKFASSGIFKIPMSDQWLVLISDPALIDELRKMPDDVANLRGAIFEVSLLLIFQALQHPGLIASMTLAVWRARRAMAFRTAACTSTLRQVQYQSGRYF